MNIPRISRERARSGIRLASRLALVLLVLFGGWKIFDLVRDNAHKSDRIARLERHRAHVAEDVLQVVTALNQEIDRLKDQLRKAGVEPGHGSTVIVRPDGSTTVIPPSSPTPQPQPEPSSRPSQKPSHKPSHEPRPKPRPSLVCAAGTCVLPCPKLVCPSTEGAVDMSPKQVVHVASATQRKIADIAERVGWTAAEAAVGYVITVVVPDLPAAYTAPIAAALAALKAWIATQLGNGSSAATLPESLDPAPEKVAAGVAVVPEPAPDADDFRDSAGVPGYGG